MAEHYHESMELQKHKILPNIFLPTFYKICNFKLMIKFGSYFNK